MTEPTSSRGPFISKISSKATSCGQTYVTARSFRSEYRLEPVESLNLQEPQIADEGPQHEEDIGFNTAWFSDNEELLCRIMSDVMTSKGIKPKKKLKKEKFQDIKMHANTLKDFYIEDDLRKAKKSSYCRGAGLRREAARLSKSGGPSPKYSKRKHFKRSSCF